MSADALLWAEARGQETHGVRLLPVYVRRIRSGAMDARGRVRVRHTGAALLWVNGNNALGPWVATRAMSACIGAAAESGIAAASVQQSNHFGAAGYVAQIAAKQGYIGLAFSNAPPSLAAPDGRRPVLGTNPVAVAIPREGAEPMITDLALSAGSKARIRAALGHGESIPEGWAIDAHGNPTRDPAAALAGALLPLGGPKGYALALAVEALTGLLAGGRPGWGARHLHEDQGGPQGISHLLMAINPGTAGDYGRRAARLAAEIQREPGVRMPGDRGLLFAREAQRSGIVLEAGVRADLERLGTALCVPLPSGPGTDG